MTPEARAAALLNAASDTALLDGYQRHEVARWHSLISVAIGEALREARDLCQYLPDRIAIGELMIGEKPFDQSASPGLIECFVCEGLGRIGAVECRACNGVGRIADSGPPPDPNPGMLAFKPCGCASDWFGAGAPPDYQVERRKLWESQGWSARLCDFKEAGPLITAGAGCRHGQDATS